MSIAKSAIRGVAWNMTTGVGTRMIGLVCTLILTHFIAPYEYGEVSAASISVLTAAAFTAFPFGQYLIASNADAEHAWHVLVLHVLLGLAALGLLIVFATPLGVLLDAPDMARFVPGFALAALIERVQLVPERLLQRQMRFRATALSRGAGELSFVAVSLALVGQMGGYAIVVGNVARALVVAVAMIALSDRREWLAPTRVRGPVLRTLLGYGMPAYVGGLAGFVATRWDNLLISGMYGPEVMGRYALAYNLADTPTSGVADHIGDVLLPSFSRMENDQRRAALVRSASLMALLLSPLAVGLGAVAPTVVTTFFKPDWYAMGWMLTILSCISVVKPVTWTMISFSYAQQRTTLLMWTGLFKAAAIVVLVLSLGQLGPNWACVGVGVAHAGYLVLFAALLQRYEQVPAARMLASTLPPLLACVPMVLAVRGVREVLAQAGMSGPGLPRLGAEVAAGALAYIVAALILARSVSRDFLNLVRNALRR